MALPIVPDGEIEAGDAVAAAGVAGGVLSREVGKDIVWVEHRELERGVGEGVRERVLDDGVVDEGERGRDDGKGEGMPTESVEVVVEAWRDECFVVEKQCVALANGIVDGVVDRANRLDVDGERESVGAGAVVHIRDERYGVLSVGEIEVGVLLSGRDGVVEKPEDVGDVLVEGLLPVDVEGDGAEVREMDALSAKDGVGEREGEEAVREAVGGAALHLEGAEGAAVGERREGAAIVAGGVDAERVGGGESEKGVRSLVPSVGEPFGDAKNVVLRGATEVGGDLLAGAGEGEIGVAEMRALIAVARDELHFDGLSVERREVDADGGPVLPEDVAVGVPTQERIGDEIEVEGFYLLRKKCEKTKKREKCLF